MKRATTVREWESSVRQALLDWKAEHGRGYKHLYKEAFELLVEDLKQRRAEGDRTVVHYTDEQIIERVTWALPGERTIRNFVNRKEMMCHERLNALSFFFKIDFKIGPWGVC